MQINPAAITSSLYWSSWFQWDYENGEHALWVFRGRTHPELAAAGGVVLFGHARQSASRMSDYIIREWPSGDSPGATGTDMQGRASVMPPPSPLTRINAQLDLKQSFLKAYDHQSVKQVTQITFALNRTWFWRSNMTYRERLNMIEVTWFYDTDNMSGHERYSSPNANKLRLEHPMVFLWKS